MYPVFDEETVLISVCILYPVCSLQSAFYTLSAFYTQSAICSLQSAFYTDRILINPSNTQVSLCAMLNITDPVMQCRCALLLTMVFSTGESVPFTLYGKAVFCSVIYIVC